MGCHGPPCSAKQMTKVKRIAIALGFTFFGSHSQYPTTTTSLSLFVSSDLLLLFLGIDSIFLIKVPCFTLLISLIIRALPISAVALMDAADHCAD